MKNNNPMEDNIANLTNISVFGVTFLKGDRQLVNALEVPDVWLRES